MVGRQRADADVLCLRQFDLTPEQGKKLKALLAEQLTGFREVFAKGA